MTKTKLMSAVFAALTIAAPLALSAAPAAAAPVKAKPTIQIARYDARHDNGRGHVDVFHDRNHRPPMKVEHRPRQPHGHYRWRTGQWQWSHNQWSWAPGIWIRF